MTVQIARCMLLRERNGYGRPFLPWLPAFLYKQRAG